MDATLHVAETPTFDGPRHLIDGSVIDVRFFQSVGALGHIERPRSKFVRLINRIRNAERVSQLWEDLF